MKGNKRKQKTNNKTQKIRENIKDSDRKKKVTAFKPVLQ
jgi:hypothetical protein